MAAVIEQVPSGPGSFSPILQYFGILLEKGELNHSESIEHDLCCNKVSASILYNIAHRGYKVHACVYC